MAKPAIVFIGFMGAGKSTALAAAREAGLETTEIDALMERELGMPIAEAFERHGEEGFRAREAEVVGALLEEADGGAIALGGGSILSRADPRRARPPRRRLAAGRRQGGLAPDRPQRPPARAPAPRTSPACWRRAEPLYEELADAVVPVGRPRRSPRRALPSILALAELPAGTKLLWAASASGEYPVLVGRGLLGAGWWPLEGRRFCVTDRAVAPLYAERLGPLAATVEVEPGEGAKTMAEAERVLRELARAGMTREDHVVALGGGVVGDLAGFCAHLYQRGVPVVQVPTTLVAQVDSAYGGKTGVDLPEGKNYAGAYQLPAAVIADTDGAGDAAGGGAGGRLRRGAEDRAAGRRRALGAGAGDRGARPRRSSTTSSSPAPATSARWSPPTSATTACAPSLNLGHTVGHAIEAASGYTRYRHGEAIGLGLLAALRLSDAPRAARRRSRRSSRRHDLPVAPRPRRSTVDAILDALQRDKKRTAAGVGFVLLSEPGEPRVGQLVDPDRVRAAVEELLG